MGNRIVTYLQKYRKFGIILIVLLAIGATTYSIWNRRASAEHTINASDLMVYRMGEDSTDIALLPWSMFAGAMSDYTSYIRLMDTIGLKWPTGQAWWRLTDIGGGDYSLSVALPMRNRNALGAVQSRLKREAVYKGVDIFQLQMEKGRKVALAQYRGLFILGRFPLQIEAAITALQNGGSHTAKSLLPTETYLSLDNLLLASEWPLPPHLKQEIGRWRSGMSGIKWQSSGSKDSLLFNGSVISPAKVKLDTMAAPEDSWSYLPAQAEWYHIWPLLPLKENTTAYHNYLRPVAGRYALSMAMPGNREPVYFLQLKDAQQAEVQLNQLASELGELERYDYQMFAIRQVLSDDLFEPIGITVKNPHLAVLGDYLLIGSRKAAIQQVLASILANQTLNQQVDFLKIWGQVEQREISGWYYEEQKQWIKASPDSSFFSHHQLLLKISSNGKIKGAYLENEDQNQLQEASLLWAAPLLSEARSGVQYMEDGDGKSFLVQDTENRLYRFDKEGQLIFRRLLDGAIIGAIQAVDYFRTGKACYSFSTPSRIYLINENGEDIGAYPIQMAYPITTPVLAANLVGDQRYAFFVADTAGSIYGFDQSGSTLPAWDGIQLDSTLHHSLQHVQRASKDYFLALTDAGTFYALDKEGRPQFDSIKTSAQFRSPVYYQEVAPAGRIALGDIGGMAHIINLEGAYFRLKMSNANKLNGRFLFLNMAGDSRKDYLAYGKQRMSLNYYREDKFLQLWDKKVPISIDTAFTLPHQTYDWVGVLNIEEQRISVVLPDGSLHAATPLAGTTPFCLASEEAGFCQLVVGNGNRLYAYRIMDLQ